MVGKSTKTACAILLLLFGFELASANAYLLLWNISGDMGGNLNQVGFPIEPFTIQLTVDPTSVTDQPMINGSTVVWANVLQGTISVNNVGSGSFNYSMLVFDNSTYDGAGFSANNGPNALPQDLLDLQGPQFATYGLTEPLGPLNFSKPSYFNSLYGTSIGIFYVGVMSDVTLSVEVVPEPSVLSLLSTAGVVLFVVYLCKRRLSTIT